MRWRGAVAADDTRHLPDDGATRSLSIRSRSPACCGPNASGPPRAPHRICRGGACRAASGRWHCCTNTCISLGLLPVWTSAHVCGNSPARRFTHWRPVRTTSGWSWRQPVHGRLRARGSPFAGGVMHRHPAPCPPPPEKPGHSPVSDLRPRQGTHQVFPGYASGNRPMAAWPSVDYSQALDTGKPASSNFLATAPTH